jgi:UPF0755 protein
MPREGKSTGRILLRVGGIVLLVVIAAVGWLTYDVFYGGNTFASGGTKVFFVSRGQAFGTIADSLEASGIVRDRALFVFVGKIFGGTDRMQVGKYEFSSGVSNLDIFLALREGKGALTIPVLLPEGSRARRYAGRLARTIGTDSSRYMSLVNNERFARSLGIGRSSLEGYLMPDTYNLTWQQDEESIIRAQVGEFWKTFTDSLKERAREIRLSMHEVVTLASIIEGEVVLEYEAERVSGVYHNRLKKGMLLQADPTIQFFVENGPRRLTYADLKVDHPYNTYRKKGLPPGPVSNPGRNSIVAALYPENHKYIYFVANGKGGHSFSTSYSEHLKHVRKFRRDRARREAATSGTRNQTR